MSDRIQDNGSDEATTRTTSDPTADPEHLSTTRLYVIFGGIVSILLSFLPLSPVFGGIVAGYLEEGGYRAGAKVGSLAGVVVFVPFIFFLSFMFIFATFSIGNHLGDQIPIWVGVVLMVALAAVYTVGLSAIGGILGIYVNKEL